jgi:hypothetical protein
MPRQTASIAIPIVALIGVVMCGGGAMLVSAKATPGRQPEAQVKVRFEAPPAEDYTQTLQLRSVCDGKPFRTFTVSPSAWEGDAAGWSTQLPTTGQRCEAQVRTLPSQEAWESSPMGGGNCLLSVEPLRIRC